MNPVRNTPVRSNEQIHLQRVDIQNEIRINDAYCRIMSTPMPDEQRKQELSQLLRERATLLRHIPVKGLKDSVIFFNMKQIGLPPTPLCPAYNKMRVGTISHYHGASTNIAVVRLDESALQHIPKEILEKAGDLSGKQVEFIWTAIDGKIYVKCDKINLVTHIWAHLHALPHDDVNFDVDMGVFPEVGFQPYNKAGAVAFNSISPMRVYTHFDFDKGYTLFSPNNAHFEIIPGSPFGVFWSVTKKDNRIAFTKNLVIFDYDHSICQSLLKSICNCDNLSTHLERLANTKNAIQKALTLPDRDLMNAFHALPPAFQYGVYQEAWILLGSLRGIHGDFGKASFENHTSLNVKFHCSHDQRKEAIAKFALRLEHLLIDSQMDLMLHCQPLQKGNNVLKMLQCAQLLEETHEIKNTFTYSQSTDRITKINENEAESARINALQLKKEAEIMALFEQFSPDEKEAVFYAIWDLSNCPRGNSKFGKETLFSQKTDFDLKAQAFLLAASCLTPKFGEPPIPAAPRIEIVPQHEIPQIPHNFPIEPSFKEMPATLPEVNASQPSIPQIPMPSVVELSPQQVLEAMYSLAYDKPFQNLTPVERKAPIMDLFNHLPVEIKNRIYGKVYEYSNDPNKGGDGWGENHVSDDLNALIEALQDILG